MLWFISLPSLVSRIAGLFSSSRCNQSQRSSRPWLRTVLRSGGAVHHAVAVHASPLQYLSHRSRQWRSVFSHLLAIGCRKDSHAENRSDSRSSRFCPGESLHISTLVWISNRISFDQETLSVGQSFIERKCRCGNRRTRLYQSRVEHDLSVDLSLLFKCPDHLCDSVYSVDPVQRQYDSSTTTD